MTNGYMKPSSYLLFARKVTGKGWTSRMIRRKFHQQVEKEDYDKDNQAEIINYLISLSKKV